jgi:Co/Zn/Cd efflux system component
MLRRPRLTHDDCVSPTPDNRPMSNCACDDPIDASALQARQRRILIAVLAMNIATFVMRVAASFMSGSSALLSGALDNFGDGVTYALSFAVVGASAPNRRGGALRIENRPNAAPSHEAS